MNKTKPRTSVCPKDHYSATSRSRELSPKESRDLVFLYSIMIDQIDWLLANLQQIVSDSDGDIISSWLRRYVTDTSGEVSSLPDSLWNGCLADYRVQRDQILEQWWLTNMGCGPYSAIQPVSGELFPTRGDV